MSHLGAKKPIVRRLGLNSASISLALFLPVAAMAQTAGSMCGALANGYGPFDYRTERDRLAIVETHHFTPQVEALIRGQEGYIGGDLDYTLRASPNHHRALLAMMRFAERLKVDQVQAAGYTVECYFIRAVSFRPDDPAVRMLYAIYLKGRSRQDEAMKQLSHAKSVAGENAFTHHNIGLVYFDLAAYDQALEQSHVAARLGFSRTDLKDRLVAANKWVDPPIEVAPLPAAPASGAKQ